MDLIKSDYVDIYCDDFVGNTLNDLFCEAFPLKVKHVSIKQATNPWISRNVRDVIKLKSHYFKLFKLGFVTRGETMHLETELPQLLLKQKVATISSYLNEIEMISDPLGKQFIT